MMSHSAAAGEAVSVLIIGKNIKLNHIQLANSLDQGVNI